MQSDSSHTSSSFKWCLNSHVYYAVAFSVMTKVTMSIAGAQGP